MSIEFRRKTVAAQVLDPRQNFASVTHNMEFRYDPLTGRSTRLAHIGMIKPKPLDYSSYDGEKKGFCPFCPPNMDKVTSLFPKELIPEGRIRRGETTLIANIAPYDAYSGLVVLSDKHVLTIDDLTEKILTDALGLAGDFLERVRHYDTQIPYYFLGWNYMPPSGGGLIHTHIQVFGSNDPGNLYIEYLRASNEYKARTGRSFWVDYLVEEERLNERYLGKTGEVHWVVPFAPLGILGDAIGILPRPCSPADLQDPVVTWLVAGLRRLFNYYKDQGIYSFNASLHFSPEGESDFPLILRISPRTFLNTRYYSPDTNFFNVMLQQPMCVAIPEELAEKISPYFAR
jgi:galactose-1-phosphate uridylyltransferase